MTYYIKGLLNYKKKKMEKKKICFIVATPETAKSFFKEPIIVLSQHYDVYLAANIKDKDDLSDLSLAGYRSIPIERRPNIKKDLKALKMLTAYFKEMKFDSVHSMSKKASLLTSIAGRIAKIPYRLHHFTGQMWCVMKGFRKLFYKYMDTFIVWSDTHMLVDGESQRDYLEQTGILKKGQGTVLGKGSICGINTARFCRNEESRKRIRTELNLSDEMIVYLFLGRLKREKGSYELFDAFNQMIPSCPKAVLLLVGADEENCMQHLHEYSNLKKSENVIYYGTTSKPEDLYNAADVYVLPTYREGFGLSILEASSTGLPVITSDTYGVRDSIVENETGLRCKTFDIETLKDCMIRLYNDGDERKRLGQNGIEYVHEYFTIEKICGAWLEYYLSVVK